MDTGERQGDWYGSESQARTRLVIHQAQGGSEQAWTELYHRCLGLIRSSVRRLAGRRILGLEEADDLVMQVLREMVKGLPTFEYRSHAEFVGWIVRLVRTTIAERACHYGALKRPPPATPIDGSGPHTGLSESWIPSPAAGPEANAAVRDELDLVKRRARLLASDDRAMLQLFLELGDDMHAIGAALGITSDAARMRWLRVRRRLARVVAQWGEAA